MIRRKKRKHCVREGKDEHSARSTESATYEKRSRWLSVIWNVCISPMDRPAIAR